MKRRATQKKAKAKKAKKARRTCRRSQRGGGFAYEIPSDALVGYRSMDDNGTEVPRIVKMSDITRDSERA